MTTKRSCRYASATTTDSIGPRFVRESLDDGEPLLQDDAEGRRVAREDRLRALGFEEPTAEQCKANLALNVALRKWPMD